MQFGLTHVAIDCSDIADEEDKMGYLQTIC